ncbi:MAG: protein kinase, partial [Polyangiaceae bacterium]
PIPLSIAVAIMVSTLHGLHAAHEARDEKGEPLGIVHRDISPHNILAGADGMVRVLDFGVAKAIQGRTASQDTALPPGTVKGKFSYMAPETLRGEPATRQADIFSAAIVFWELVTGHKLFGAPTEQERILKVLKGNFPPPSALVPGLPVVVDRIVLRGLSPNPEDRYETADEMAADLENMLSPASQRAVGDWVTKLAEESLERREGQLQQIEISNINSMPPSAERPPTTSMTVERSSEKIATPPAVSIDTIASETTPISSPNSLGRSGKLAIVVGAAAIAVLALALVTRAMRAPAAGDAPVSAAARVEVAPAPTGEVIELPEPAQDPSGPVASPVQPKAAEPSEGPKATPTSPHPVSVPRSTRHSAPRPSGNAKDFLPTHL